MDKWQAAGGTTVAGNGDGVAALLGGLGEGEGAVKVTKAGATIRIYQAKYFHFVATITISRPIPNSRYSNRYIKNIFVPNFFSNFSLVKCIRLPLASSPR